jgi:hypothetical protein
MSWCCYSSHWLQREVEELEIWHKSGPNANLVLFVLYDVQRIGFGKETAYTGGDGSHHTDGQKMRRHHGDLSKHHIRETPVSREEKTHKGEIVYAISHGV